MELGKSEAGDLHDTFKNAPEEPLENQEKCSKKLIIIISGAIVVVIAIIIIIVFATKKDSDGEEHQKTNTLKLIYYTEEEGAELTLFSSKILSHISSLEIDGKEKEVINNYYTFDVIGEHTIKIKLKTNLESLSELFKYNTYLIQADFSDLITNNLFSWTNISIFLLLIFLIISIKNFPLTKHLPASFISIDSPSIFD